jgi:hypothetical protein
MVLWHVDPLLGNDREISNYTTAIAIGLLGCSCCKLMLLEAGS